MDDRRVDGAGTTAESQSYRFTADDLAAGTHRFRLRQVDLGGTTRSHDAITVEVGMAQPVRLSAPAPNPVRREATISFAVKEVSETTLRLYNVLGQHVRTLYRGTPTVEETEQVHLTADDLASGVYVLRLRAGEHTATQRVTVVK